MIEVWRVMVRLLGTRGRLAVTFFIAVGTVGLGVVAARSLPEGANADISASNLVASLGLSLLIPAVSLAFATASFGQLIEDRTLVYLWLRPIGRLPLAIAVLLATLTLAVPIAVIPLVVSASLFDAGWERIGLTAVSTSLATIAYSSVFVGVGLVVRRALAWGVGYFLIWEGFVGVLAQFGAEGGLRLAIRHYALSILEQDSISFEVFVLAGVALAGLAFTALCLRLRDVA